MFDLVGIGRALMAAGLILAAVGFVLVVSSRIPGLDRLGRLPGDIVLNRGPLTIAVPIVSSLLVSVILTLILNLLLRR
ncbi:MAG: DUF2905 domain-containing protein [Thermomicrobiales bacterium]